MLTSNSCCVIGTGFLGARITGELSRLKLPVTIYDHDSEQLRKLPNTMREQKNELVERGLMSPNQSLLFNICENLSQAVSTCEFIFEAVVEDIDVKTFLLQKVTANCPTKAIICTNTLNLSIQDIAKESLFKEEKGASQDVDVKNQRVIGCRFLAPVYCVPVVEVTTTEYTTTDVLHRLDEFFTDLGFRILRRRANTEPFKLTSIELERYWSAQRRLVNEQIRQEQCNISQESSLTTQSLYTCSLNVNNNEHVTERINHAVDAHNEHTIATMTEDMRRIEIERRFPLPKPKDKNHSEQQRPVENVENRKESATTVQSSNDRTSCNITAMIADHNSNTEAGHVDLFHRSPTIETPLQSVRTAEETVDLYAPQEHTLNQTSKINALVENHNLHTEAGHGGQHVHLKKTSSTSKETSECVVCNEYNIDCVLVPCGHMWLCYECAYTLQRAGKTCPACRQNILSILRVYHP